MLSVDYGTLAQSISLPANRYSDEYGPGSAIESTDIRGVSLHEALPGLPVDQDCCVCG
jgi:hypothetical protein